MGFADFDIMGKCKTIIEKVEELATNLSEVKTSASGAKTSADNAKTSADTAASNTSVIGATGNTGGSATAGTVMGKLNKLITDLTTHMGRWTNTRAGYIDNIRSYTVTNNTASKTGVLSAKLAYVISLLENSSYGLSKLKNYLEDSSVSYKGAINNGTALASKVYANSAEITAGTTILEVNDVIFDNTSSSSTAAVRITLSYIGGGGEVTLQIDDWSIDLTTSANNQSTSLNYSVAVPTGVKIKSIKVVAKDKITCYSNNSYTPQATLSPSNANAFFV